MNIDSVKLDLKKRIGNKVKVTVYGMRNRVDSYEGTVYKIYPNIFTILTNSQEKSFAYRDIITKDIKVKFL